MENTANMHPSQLPHPAATTQFPTRQKDASDDYIERKDDGPTSPSAIKRRPYQAAKSTNSKNYTEFTATAAFLVDAVFEDGEFTSTIDLVDSMSNGFYVPTVMQDVQLLALIVTPKACLPYRGRFSTSFQDDPLQSSVAVTVSNVCQLLRTLARSASPEIILGCLPGYDDSAPELPPSQLMNVTKPGRFGEQGDDASPISDAALQIIHCRDVCDVIRLMDKTSFSQSRLTVAKKSETGSGRKHPSRNAPKRSVAKKEEWFAENLNESGEIDVSSGGWELLDTLVDFWSTALHLAAPQDVPEMCRYLLRQLKPGMTGLTRPFVQPFMLDLIFHPFTVTFDENDKQDDTDDPQRKMKHTAISLLEMLAKLQTARRLEGDDSLSNDVASRMSRLEPDTLRQFCAMLDSGSFQFNCKLFVSHLQGVSDPSIRDPNNAMSTVGEHLGSATSLNSPNKRRQAAGSPLKATKHASLSSFSQVKANDALDMDFLVKSALGRVPKGFGPGKVVDHSGHSAVNRDKNQLLNTAVRCHILKIGICRCVMAVPNAQPQQVLVSALLKAQRDIDQFVGVAESRAGNFASWQSAGFDHDIALQWIKCRRDVSRMQAALAHTLAD